jgi:serpin B
MWLRKISPIVGWVLCLSFWTSCRHPQPEKTNLGQDAAPPVPSASASQARQFAKASSELGVELYRKLGADSQGNMVIAPASIAIALAITWTGTQGKTRQEMTRTLHLSGTESAVVGSARHLLSSLNALNGEAATLRLSNALFVEQSYPLEPAFLEVARRHFEARVESLDFKRAADNARRSINAWGAEQTEQQVSRSLPSRSLDSKTRLVLTNAFSFLCTWQSPFNEVATASGDFHVNGQNVHKVPMMRQKGKFGLGAADRVRILELPYTGSAVTMLVVLPDERDGLNEVEERLTVERLESWAKSLQEKSIDVALPRFGFPATALLKKPLRQLGMKLAFDAGRADFRGMTARGGLFVQDVHHHAFVKVDEHGVRAGAATTVPLRLLSGSRTKARFVADHPFLFAIRHRASGTLLLLGRVVVPETASNE